jgi:hypothetical protein
VPLILCCFNKSDHAHTSSLDSKDLSRKLQLNCIISFYFRLYLILHACVARFDVMENLEFF